MKVRNPSKRNKISGKAKVTLPEKQCDQYPAISYRYMTTNKQYSLKDKCEPIMLAHILHKRLLEITQKPWIYWSQQDKGYGFETLEYSRININPSGCELTGDEKIIIFRFDSSRCRILGFRKDSCPTLYIIGFDLNFSAYNHGN